MKKFTKILDFRTSIITSVDAAIFLLTNIINNFRSIGWIVGFIFLTINIIIDNHSYIAPDAAWYLNVAHILLHGGRFYYDIFEFNFPLIFYITIIPVKLAALTGYTETGIYIAFLIVLGLLGIAISYFWIKSTAAYENIPFYNILIATLFLVCFLPPILKLNWGSKCAVFLFMVIPYFFSCLYYTSHTCQPPLWLKILTGFMAAVGLFLKPQYICFWIVMELYLMIQKRRLFCWWRLENIIILIIGIIYISYLFWITPEVLFKLLPMATVSYRPTDFSSLNSIIDTSGLSAIIINNISFIVCSALLIPSIKNKITWHLFAGYMAALIVVIAEMRGHEDQLYTTSFFGMLLLSNLIYEFFQIRTLGFIRTSLFVLISIIYIIISVDSINDAYESRTKNQWTLLPEIIPLLNRYAFNKTVFAIDTKLFRYFPAINYSYIPWASKLPLVTSPNIEEYAEQHGNNISLNSKKLVTDAKHYMLEALVNTLTIRKPDVLFIYENPINLYNACLIPLFDYYSRYPAFTEAMKNYQKIDSTIIYTKKNAKTSLGNRYSIYRYNDHYYYWGSTYFLEPIPTQDGYIL